MRLRCIQGGGGSPFVKGRIYDVAEIMEMPLHCMVRKPNGQWPKPGERWFAWHPEECFASPRKGLEILPCGYRIEEFDCFGVIIPSSKSKRVPRFRSALRAALDQCQTRGFSLWYRCFHNVRTSCCFPDLERTFCVVGVDYNALGRTTSYRAVRRAIQRVLAALDLTELSSTIDDLSFEFWCKSWRSPGGLWPNY